MPQHRKQLDGRRQAQSCAPEQSVAPRKDKGSRRLVRVFLAPTLIGLGLFTFVPIVGLVALAFFRWDIISAPDSWASTTSSPSARTPPCGWRS